jgi:hypothetical protein
MWRLESGALAGWGRGWSGDGPKTTARSRVRVGPIVIVFVFCYQGVVWVEGEEAPSAGHGQEAGKLGHVYMPGPQSGRMQYEENKKKGRLFHPIPPSGDCNSPSTPPIRLFHPPPLNPSSERISISI